MHAHTDRPVDTRHVCETGKLLPKRVHQRETSADGPLGVLVVGLRIAKVDHEFLPTILGDLALKLPDNACTRLLIEPDHGIEVIRGQGPGEWGLGHEGTHEDGQLSAFSVECSGESPVGGILNGRRVRESRAYGGRRQPRLLSRVEHQWCGWRCKRQCQALVFRGGNRPFLHWYHDAISSPIDCLDELWATPAVPNRLAYGFYRTVEHRIADELLRPDLRTQLLLGDDPLGMRQQVGQDLERFTP
jgi:hypothetical protein